MFALLQMVLSVANIYVLCTTKNAFINMNLFNSLSRTREKRFRRSRCSHIHDNFLMATFMPENDVCCCCSVYYEADICTNDKKTHGKIFRFEFFYSGAGQNKVKTK